VSDPNQERRDRCKVCKGFLPKRKAKYCSYYCAGIHQRRKHPGRNGFHEFRLTVREEVQVPAGKEAAAERLVASGAVLGWRNRQGRLACIGVPLAPGELRLLATAEEKKERRKATRLMPERKRRKRQAQRARRRQGQS
jgi:hypothetical protein